MRLACPSCGAAAHGAQAWAVTPDGDRLAVEDLIRQARSARPELARLLRILAERAKLTSGMVRTIRDGRRARGGDPAIPGLSRIYRDILAAIEEDLSLVPGDSVASRVTRRGITATVIGDLLAESVEPLRETIRTEQARLVELTNEQMQAGGIQRQADLTAIGAAVAGFDSTFWGETIIAPTQDAIWEGLRTSVMGEPLDATVARIAERTERSIPQAITEARTQVAEFDRFVTAQVAADAGAELFLYAGPVDGITRPFCAELVGHAFTLEQVQQLDNAQTSASPAIAGGGYNCRHSFSPIDAVTAEVMELPMGTMAQVRAANAAAKRGR